MQFRRYGVVAASVADDVGVGSHGKVQYAKNDIELASLLINPLELTATACILPRDMGTPGDRLREIRIMRGFATAKSAALAMKVSVVTYSHHEGSVRPFPAKRAREYAEFFRITPEWLLYGRRAILETPPDTVPVLGKIGLAERLDAFDEVLRYLLPTLPTAETEAVQISEEDALGGILHNWIVFIEAKQAQITPAMHNTLCLVELSDGAVLLRQIIPATTPETFHLVALSGAMMIDQKIVSARPVIAMTPR